MKIIALTLLLLLAACATDSALTDARRLNDDGNTEAALGRLEQAMHADPRSPALRIEWARLREAIASKRLQQADALRSRRLYAEAADEYREVLRLQPDHTRARNSLAALAAEERTAGRMREAETLLAAQKTTEAQALLQAVLADDPGNPDARNALRQIAERAMSESLAPPVLKAAGRKVTMEFREANVRAVFDVIARTTGVNFVFDRDVRADLRTTIVVRNSTVEDVMKLVLVSNQLERKVLNDNTVLVFPATPAKLKEYQDLVVRSFYVANADVKQVLNLVRTVVKTRDVFVDERLNLLVMRDTPEAVRLAEKVIATQDLAEPEVTLEVEVLEVGATRLRELGLKYPERVSFQDPAALAAGTGYMRATGNLVGFIATPAVTLNLRQQEAAANVLANPRIRVKNREKARIHIGDKVPVITTTATANVGVSASVNYLDVGLKLEVEPTIHLEGDVGMRVGLEVSNIVREVPTTGGGLAYQVGTRNAATTLRLRDGETQVLAGLIQDEDRSTASRVPGLGNLPVLGRLFSNNLDNRTKTEIVLLITPRIVRNLQRSDYVQTQFFSGTEAQVGAAPLRLGAVDAGSLSMSSSGPSAPAVLAGAPSAPLPALLPRGESPVAPAQLPATISVAAPGQAANGREINIAVTLLPHPAAAHAELELVYDPAVFAPAAGAGTPGRAPLKLTKGAAGAAQAEVRLRVVGQALGPSGLRVDNIAIRDAGGNPVAAAPVPAQTVNIVP